MTVLSSNNCLSNNCQLFSGAIWSLKRLILQKKLFLKVRCTYNMWRWPFRSVSKQFQFRLYCYIRHRATSVSLVAPIASSACVWVHTCAGSKACCSKLCCDHSWIEWQQALSLKKTPTRPQALTAMMFCISLGHLHPFRGWFCLQPQVVFAPDA